MAVAGGAGRLPSKKVEPMYLIHDHPSLGTVDVLGPGIEHIGVTCNNGIAVVSVTGEWDVSKTEWFYECLHGAIDAGVAELVVDAEHLTFMDSTGVAVLAGAHRRLHAAGGTLTVRSPLPALQRFVGTHLESEPA